VLEIRSFRRDLSEFTIEVERLSIKQGKTYALLGPSGAGKTQFLLSIAGFTSLQNGIIRVAGRDVSQSPPEDRDISIIFQNPNLFPHLDVRQNIEFGSREPLIPESLIYLLDLADILDLPVNQLSGGQTQLIALARALAPKPRVLLMDEPFSALDGQNRRLLISRFKRVQKQLGTTCLLVTHNLDDCVSLADEVGILEKGSLVESGNTKHIFNSPGSAEIARFLGLENLFSGTLQYKAAEIPSSIDCDGVPATFNFENNILHVLARKEGGAYALIRPQDITLSTAQPISTSALNILPGTIVDSLEQGSVVMLTVDTGLLFKVVVTPQSFRELHLSDQKTVFLSFKASAVKIYQ